MAYDVKILADSISYPAGHRLTTFEVTFPRIVLAELNTHCALSRNSASSRAIPVKKRIRMLEEDPFIPELFGKNQKGMQPGEALVGDEALAAASTWHAAKSDMIAYAQELARLEVHKQYANRLLEPFAWHTAVITATDWDNFFHLRVNPLAQGELRKAAELMQAAREASAPSSLNRGDWHLPYVSVEELFAFARDGIDPVKVSVARCARVSYLTQNGVRDVSEDLALYDRLVEAGHMSPLEHVARPMTGQELRITQTFDVSFDGGPTVRSGGWYEFPVVGDIIRDSEGDLKITAVRGPLHYCGKLNGWVSRRAYVPGEWDVLGHRNAS